ncbi:unnamed protein product [Blepharisma stoltei]|uniref:Uncharacterized protein n=1 Tax=Blepharisma stoltei TaxID=1481888 RepID=A0AAU9IHN7_9CILI|nr:unnamed protein product [Blepharisma stoltei]
MKRFLILDLKSFLYENLGYETLLTRYLAYCRCPSVEEADRKFYEGIVIFKGYHPCKKVHQLYERLARLNAESEKSDKIALHMLFEYITDYNHADFPKLHSRFLGERSG